MLQTYIIQTHTDALAKTSLLKFKQKQNKTKRVSFQCTKPHCETQKVKQV